jgi:hypothetical protein
MKLTEQEALSIQEATGLDPLSPDAAAQAGLESHFGEHTFYIAEQGLFVFERIEATNGADTAQAVCLAVWTEQDGKQALAVIEPQPTEVTVELKAA